MHLNIPLENCQLHVSHQNSYTMCERLQFSTSLVNQCFKIFTIFIDNKDLIYLLGKIKSQINPLSTVFIILYVTFVLTMMYSNISLWIINQQTWRRENFFVVIPLSIHLFKTKLAYVTLYCCVKRLDIWITNSWETVIHLEYQARIYMNIQTRGTKC